MVSNNIRDLWTWRAVYTDGTTLDEFDEQGEERGFAAVDQSRLDTFLLIPQREGLDAHELKVTPGATPIFFRRRTVGAGPGDELTPIKTIHCLGFERTVNGRGVMRLTFLMEDGSAFISDDYDAV